MARYIDADELLRQSIRIEGHIDLPSGKAQNFSAINDTTILNFPTADVAPVVHGRWESDQGLFEAQMARCSNCKTESYLQSLQEVSEDGNELPKYCPVCGAKMDLDGD